MLVARENLLFLRQLIRFGTRILRVPQLSHDGKFPSSCGTFLISFLQNTNHLEKDIPIFTNTMSLVANSSNWRKVAKELIGDEPVGYEEKSKKDSLRKFPVVTIFSEDKEALDRVLTKAAEVE